MQRPSVEEPKNLESYAQWYGMTTVESDSVGKVIKKSDMSALIDMQLVGGLSERKSECTRLRQKCVCVCV